MSSSTKSNRPWFHRLLLRCGDIELNPGPTKSAAVVSGIGEGDVIQALPMSRSRVSLASIKSSIRKRREKVYIEPTPLWNSCRLLLAIMGFLGFLNVYAMRVNLSVAMVCMINHTATNAATTTVVVNNSSFGYSADGNLSYMLSGNFSGEDVAGSTEDFVGDAVNLETGRCGIQSGNTSVSSEDGEFTWSKDIQGLLLGSFFWGYMTTQIAGGWLSARFGGKRVYGFFMFGCSICTLFMPLAARVDYRFLLALRFLAGVGQGVTFPAMNVLWANWAPPLESSKLGSFSYSGSQLGNVMTFPIAGLLCEYLGWPSIFYFLGCLGLLWFVAWWFLVFDSPAEHPRITRQERGYIHTSLQGKMTTSRQAHSHVPVCTIMTSRPVWGIILTHTCSNFGTYTFLTNIPTYMKEVLHFDIKQNGLLSALPYIGFWLSIVVSGQLADLARSRGLVTTTQARKIGNSIGMLFPGIFVAAVGYMTCEQSTTAVILLTLGVAMSGFQYGSGWMVNPVDIAPKYAGVIFGISNTFATVPGFVAPIVIGIITKNQTQAEWQTVFFIATTIYAVGALAYILLGSGELQPWARQEEDPEGTGNPNGGSDALDLEENPLLDGDSSGTKPGKSVVTFSDLQKANDNTEDNDDFEDKGKGSEPIPVKDGEAGSGGGGEESGGVGEGGGRAGGGRKRTEPSEDVQFY
ncbi:hypothetical protein V1264_014101 [Littorina saxatilis]